MSRVFVTSDHHFQHQGILRFNNSDGTPLRPFSSYDEMEHELITRWNATVTPQDKVYVLGDFSMGKTKIAIADKLNGRKTLIMGNHDIFNTDIYLKYFDNVRAYRVLNITDTERVILSHIPIHEECLARFKFNIHGHLHGNKLANPRYVNVCVEQTNFYPVELFSLLANRSVDYDCNERTNGLSEPG